MSVSSLYPHLAKGDRLPAVGVLQKLLNARSDSALVADGIFGPLTDEALKAYQRAERRKGRRLNIDGVVNTWTWAALTEEAGPLQIIDCVDIFDKALLQLEARTINALNGSMVLVGGACNGVEQAVEAIRHAATSGGVFLLRFHGHGGPGSAAISSGEGDLGIDNHSGLRHWNVDELQSVLQRLRSIFGAYGSIQFMHCNSASGPEGQQLLSRVANIVGVPATGAIEVQRGGGVNSFRYVGRTVTAAPNGKSLRSWCSALPDFAGASLIR